MLVQEGKAVNGIRNFVVFASGLMHSFVSLADQAASGGARVVCACYMLPHIHARIQKPGQAGPHTRTGASALR